MPLPLASVCALTNLAFKLHACSDNHQPTGVDDVSVRCGLGQEVDELFLRASELADRLDDEHLRDDVSSGIEHYRELCRTIPTLSESTAVIGDEAATEGIEEGDFMSFLDNLDVVKTTAAVSSKSDKNMNLSAPGDVYSSEPEVMPVRDTSKNELPLDVTAVAGSPTGVSQSSSPQTKTSPQVIERAPSDEGETLVTRPHASTRSGRETIGKAKEAAVKDRSQDLVFSLPAGNASANHIQYTAQPPPGIRPLNSGHSFRRSVSTKPTTRPFPPPTNTGSLGPRRLEEALSMITGSHYLLSSLIQLQALFRGYYTRRYKVPFLLKAQYMRQHPEQQQADVNESIYNRVIRSHTSIPHIPSTQLPVPSTADIEALKKASSEAAIRQHEKHERVIKALKQEYEYKSFILQQELAAQSAIESEALRDIQKHTSTLNRTLTEHKQFLLAIRAEDEKLQRLQAERLVKDQEEWTRLSDKREHFAQLKRLCRPLVPTLSHGVDGINTTSLSEELQGLSPVEFEYNYNDDSFIEIMKSLPAVHAIEISLRIPHTVPIHTLFCRASLVLNDAAINKDSLTSTANSILVTSSLTPADGLIELRCMLPTGLFDLFTFKTFPKDGKVQFEWADSGTITHQVSSETHDDEAVMHDNVEKPVERPLWTASILLTEIWDRYQESLKSSASTSSSLAPTTVAIHPRPTIPESASSDKAAQEQSNIIEAQLSCSQCDLTPYIKTFICALDGHVNHRLETFFISELRIASLIGDRLMTYTQQIRELNPSKLVFTKGPSEHPDPDHPASQKALINGQTPENIDLQPVDTDSKDEVYVRAPKESSRYDGSKAYYSAESVRFKLPYEEVTELLTAYHALVCSHELFYTEIQSSLAAVLQSSLQKSLITDTARPSKSAQAQVDIIVHSIRAHIDDLVDSYSIDLLTPATQTECRSKRRFRPVSTLAVDDAYYMVGDVKPTVIGTVIDKLSNSMSRSKIRDNSLPSSSSSSSPSYLVLQDQLALYLSSLSVLPIQTYTPTTSASASANQTPILSPYHSIFAAAVGICQGRFRVITSDHINRHRELLAETIKLLGQTALIFTNDTSSSVTSIFSLIDTIKRGHNSDPRVVSEEVMTKFRDCVLMYD